MTREAVQKLADTLSVFGKLATAGAGMMGAGPKTMMFMFVAASLLKHVTALLYDYADDGKFNDSWKGAAGLAAGALLIFGGAGCQTAAPGTLGGVFTRQDTVLPVLVTNAPAVIAASGTNGAAIVQPPTVVTNWQTNVVYEVSPTTQATIETLKAANSLANPTPTEPLVSAGLAVLAGALGIVAKVKSDKAALVPTLVQGIELADSDEVKTLVDGISKQNGVSDKLHAAVQKITAAMPTNAGGGTGQS